MLRVSLQPRLTEGEVFENEVLAGTDYTENPAEEMPRDTVMARILSDFPNRVFHQVIHFAGVRRFGDTQPLSGIGFCWYWLEKL